MNWKELESVVRFMVAFNDLNLPIARINESFGVELSENTTNEEALRHFVSIKNITLSNNEV